MQIEAEALQAIEAFDWPGNVRQLINALERAKIMTDDGVISIRHLPREVVTRRSAPTPPAVAATVPTTDALSDVERAHVLEVLERERGNKARAARALGLNRRSLYRLLEKYGIADNSSPDAKTADANKT
jgi:DNA-binding NtrC family response regulator